MKKITTLFLLVMFSVAGIGWADEGVQDKKFCYGNIRCYSGPTDSTDVEVNAVADGAIGEWGGNAIAVDVDLNEEEDGFPKEPIQKGGMTFIPPGNYYSFAILLPASSFNTYHLMIGVEVDYVYLGGGCGEVHLFWDGKEVVSRNISVNFPQKICFPMKNEKGVTKNVTFKFKCAQGGSVLMK